MNLCTYLPPAVMPLFAEPRRPVARMGLDFCQGSGAVLLLGADPAPSGDTDRSSSSRALEPSYVSEARVMAECQAEATVKRRLPLAGLVGLAAVWAVKERGVKVGRLLRPGVLLPAGVIVYILGGVMYGDTCANKVLRQIPRSVADTVTSVQEWDKRWKSRRSCLEKFP